MCASAIFSEETFKGQGSRRRLHIFGRRARPRCPSHLATPSLRLSTRRADSSSSLLLGGVHVSRFSIVMGIRGVFSVRAVIAALGLGSVVAIGCYTGPGVDTNRVPDGPSVDKDGTEPTDLDGGS